MKVFEERPKLWRYLVFDVGCWMFGAVREGWMRDGQNGNNEMVGFSFVQL